jgi:hypothetical protein
MIDRRFPIGEFQYKGPYTASGREQLMAQLAALPDHVASVALHMTEEQLDTRYRPDGWTARQAIHHIADSQMHSYMRFKYALAEDGATIAPYPEDLWAEQQDAVGAPVELSLELLRATIRRWGHLLHCMSEADFARRYHHPVAGMITLDRELAMAAWHGEHHLAQARLVLGDS